MSSTSVAAETAAQSLTAFVDVTSSERGGELARRVLLLELLEMTERIEAAVRSVVAYRTREAV